MSNHSEKTKGGHNVRQHLNRIRLMSHDERRRKAAEILANGLLSKMQVAANDQIENTEDVPHVQG